MKEFNIYKELGMRIRALRKESGMSQTELASELGLTQAMLTSYETGSKRMAVETLRTFADYFNMTMDELIGDQIFNERIKEKYTIHDKVIDLIKSYGLNEDEYIKLIDYLEFIVSQREKKNDKPKKPLDVALFELKEKQYNIFEEHEEQTYVRSEDKKMR